MRKKLMIGMILIVISAALLIVIFGLPGNISKPSSIDPEFKLKNMDQSNNNYLMSIGEETVLEWNVKPGVKGTRLELPEGLENLGGSLEYNGSKQSVRVRAVKVGRWSLEVKSKDVEYTGEKSFVCIGISDEDALEKCEQ